MVFKSFWEGKSVTLEVFFFKISFLAHIVFILEASFWSRALYVAFIRFDIAFIIVVNVQGI